MRIRTSGYVTVRAADWMAFATIPPRRDHRPSQADALHLDVWRGARAIAIDPGTYSYSAPPPWDNALAETRYHNTCSVNNASQMRRQGRFLWTHWNSAELVEHATVGDCQLVLACVRAAWNTDHVHWRLFVLGPEGIDVLDALDGTTPATLRLHWNLDGSAWLRKGAVWTDADITVQIDGGPGAAISEQRGAADSPLGWSSRSYGYRIACTAIDVEIRAVRTWFHTRIGTTVADSRVIELWRNRQYRDAFQRLVIVS
jgi:hypothetical protein